MISLVSCYFALLFLPPALGTRRQGLGKSRQAGRVIRVSEYVITGLFTKQGQLGGVYQGVGGSLPLNSAKEFRVAGLGKRVGECQPFKTLLVGLER